MVETANICIYIIWSIVMVFQLFIGNKYILVYNYIPIK